MIPGGRTSAILISNHDIDQLVTTLTIALHEGRLRRGGAVPAGGVVGAAAWGWVKSVAGGRRYIDVYLIPICFFLACGQASY